MSYQTIAIVGGTGKSGRYLVDRLLGQSFRIKLLLRHPAAFTRQHPSISLVQGDIRHPQAAVQLLQGCSAVISTLGQPKGEAPIFSTASRNITAAMQHHGISRYMVTTGLSVNTPFDRKHPRVQAATAWMYAHYPETTLDKQAEYDFLCTSSLDWTLVRLPLIVQTDQHLPVKTSLEDCPGDSISAADLAVFLEGLLTSPRFIRQSPFLANV